jgi:hypothetical protein
MWFYLMTPTKSTKNKVIFKSSKETCLNNCILKEGSETDGASVPYKSAVILGLPLVFTKITSLMVIGVLLLLVPFFFPPIGKYFNACFLHDNLKIGKFRDDKFLSQMKIDNVNVIQRTIMYYAVRCYTIIKTRSFN